MIRPWSIIANSLKIMEELDDKLGIANLHNNIGVFTDRRNFMSRRWSGFRKACSATRKSSPRGASP